MLIGIQVLNIVYFVARAGWARVQRVAILSTDHNDNINPHQDAILPGSRFMQHVVKNGKRQSSMLSFMTASAHAKKHKDESKCP